MNMTRFLAKRLVLGLLTLVLLSVMTFVVTSVLPTDPARVALGRDATAQQLQSYREAQHLDDPMLTRYVTWAGGFVRGDMGVSTTTNRPVKADIMPRLSRTLTLAGIALLIAVPIAFLIGITTGRRSGDPVDFTLSVGTLLLNSMPEFVVGLGLLFIFGVDLGWFPIESSGAAFAVGWGEVEAYILPIATTALLIVPYTTRMVRANVRDVMVRPFVRSAVLRGVPQRRVSWRHIAPNASAPAVSVIAINAADLIGGLVVIETVFGFPGVGKALVDAVIGKDLPTVQALTMIIGSGFVILNLIADLVLLGLNPRLRRG